MQKRLRSIAVVMLISIGLLLLSCNSGDSDEKLITANNDVIKLEEGEKSTKVNKVDKFTFDAYQRYFNCLSGYQTPLNKVFHSKTTRFYYGIPINGDIQSMYDLFLKNWGNKVITSSNLPQQNEVKIIGRDSANFILVELINTPGKNILLGGAISKDSALMMGYYLNNNLKARILNEK